MFAPVDRQFHQHFATSPVPSRYLALIPGSNARYPLTNANRRNVSAEEAGAQGDVARSTKQGGQQVEYEDQDPRVHAIWLEEMKKNGITCRNSTSTPELSRPEAERKSATPHPSLMVTK